MPPFPIDAAGKQHAPITAPARIVSLVPSLTELVCELGLTDQLVGRTGFCIHPRDALRHIPKVGGTKDVKLDVVRALAPTHLIVNIDENRRETVEELAQVVPNVIVTHPCRPEDNLALYRLLGDVFRREAEAEALATALEAQLAAARSLAARTPPEEVIYLIWRAPWMSVSRQTYIAAMLASVGWLSLPADSDARYPEIDWHDPALATARRVFLSSEPYRFRDMHLNEVAALSGRPVTLIDGEMVSWYGSRAIQGLDYLIRLRESLPAGVSIT